MEKRVAIIGAGVSGLLACKYAVSKGLKPIVFEAKHQVGGLWTQTMESTKLQNVKAYYQFSDFPWPDSVKEKFPSSSQLLEYIQSYAQHFDLLQYVKFNSEVVSIDYVGESEDEIQSCELWGGDGKAFGSKGKWKLKVHHTKEDSTKVYEAEFVILCIGRFSGLADIPEFPEGHGPEVFSGKVIHSMDYSAMDDASAANFIKGKKIVVIGSGKSAVDIAFECARKNGVEKPCTMIQRTVHWMIPDAKPFGIDFSYWSFNRFAELMIHKPGEGLFHNILASLLTPMRWGLSKFVESYLIWKLPLRKYGMIPKYNFSFFLDQKFQLPSVKQMENEAELWKNYLKNYAGNNMYRTACISSTQIWYNDQLCKDIGCNPRRKKGFFKDLFEPYGIEDYKGLDPKSDK